MAISLSNLPALLKAVSRESGRLVAPAAISDFWQWLVSNFAAEMCCCSLSRPVSDLQQDTYSQNI